MSYEDLKRRLADGGIVILDGGTGTELQRRGVPMDAEAWCGPASLEHLSIDDQSLGAVQAVNFIQAAREAAQRQTVGAHDVIRDAVKTSTATETAPRESTPPELQRKESGIAARQPARAQALATDRDEAAPSPATAAVPNQNTPPQSEELRPPEPGETVSFLESGWSIGCTEGDRPGLPNVFSAFKDHQFIRRGSFEALVAFIEQKTGAPHGPWLIQRPKQPQQSLEPPRPDQRSGSPID
jgi:hypothetical protein